MSKAEKDQLDYKLPLDELAALYRNSDYALTEIAKTAGRRDMENGTANYIVNELGDNVYSDKTSRIGMMVPLVNETLEAIAEKQAKDEYEQNRRKAYEKWGKINFLGE